MKLLAIFFYYIKIHIFLIRQFYAISLITNKNHKMNRKYFKYINTLFVVIPMTLIMAFVGLMRNYCNYGFGEDWLFKFLKAWSVVLPVAYVSAFIIIPNLLANILHYRRRARSNAVFSL